MTRRAVGYRGKAIMAGQYLIASPNSSTTTVNNVRLRLKPQTHRPSSAIDLPEPQTAHIATGIRRVREYPGHSNHSPSQSSQTTNVQPQPPTAMPSPAVVELAECGGTRTRDLLGQFRDTPGLVTASHARTIGQCANLRMVVGRHQWVTTTVSSSLFAFTIGGCCSSPPLPQCGGPRIANRTLRERESDAKRHGRCHPVATEFWHEEWIRVYNNKNNDDRSSHPNNQA